MARLLTAGAETLNAIGDNKSMEGGITSSGTETVDTGTVKTGTKSYKSDSGAGNAAAYVAFAFTPVLSTTYYLKAWVRFPSVTTTTARAVLALSMTGVGAGDEAIYLETNGTLTLRFGGGQVGSPTAALSVDTWYCVELAAKNVASPSASYIEGRLDGSSFASSSTVNSQTVAASDVRVGWAIAGPGANKVVYADDIVLNDSTGANQNTWPGKSQSVLLVPTADNAVGTGWTLGTGTAIASNSGSTAVKNIPPLGVADLAVGSDPKQIRNASSNANTAYDATMTTYTAAGVPSGATINLLDPMVWTAAPVVTSAKAGTVGVVSNPAITAIALGAGGTAGAFWSGVAGGTYPTGWKLSRGTLTYAPAVTLGTAPVMRINQVTASTRIAVVCFMGIYVDFTAPPSAAPPFAPRTQRNFLLRT